MENGPFYRRARICDKQDDVKGVGPGRGGGGGEKEEKYDVQNGHKLKRNYLPLSSRKLGPGVRTCGYEIVTDELFSSYFC